MKIFAVYIRVVRNTNITCGQTGVLGVTKLAVHIVRDAQISGRQIFLTTKFCTVIHNILRAQFETCPLSP